MNDREVPGLAPLAEDWQRCLAVAAHPDDLEYNAACAVARWTTQGKDVSYVLATRGEAGIAGMSPDKAGPLREEEERTGAARVGVSDLTFLDHRDGLLEYGLALRRDLVREIRRHRPEVVVSITFDTRLVNGSTNQADHRVLGLAVLDAAQEAGNEWVFPELAAEGVQPWNGVRSVCYCGARNPTHAVDVTGAPLERGIASLSAHERYISALGSAAPDPRELLTMSTKAGGDRLGVPHAVAFDVYQL